MTTKLSSSNLTSNTIVLGERQSEGTILYAVTIEVFIELSS